MSFFIDSADRSRVEPLLASGLFGGVTTNPAILDKAGLGSRDIPDLVRWATGAGAERVFVQAWGDSVDELVERGEGFRALSPNVVVKVTASREGIEAAARLSPGGEVLVTAVYSATQVLPIVASGATYFAPFVARMAAAGREPMTEIARMVASLRGLGASTRLLAGSLRTPEQMLELTELGVRDMTLGPDVWDLVFGDELTAEAVANFDQLARKA